VSDSEKVMPDFGHFQPKKSKSLCTIFHTQLIEKARNPLNIKRYKHLNPLTFNPALKVFQLMAQN